MPCYHPQRYYHQEGTGRPTRHERPGCRPIDLPCGTCIGCRTRVREDWATRCYLESTCHEQNAFLTLTFDHVSFDNSWSLSYTHIRQFLYRVRNHLARNHNGKKVRYYAAGEYGEQNLRPHWHVLLFGYDYSDDRLQCNSVRSDHRVYSSFHLSKHWPHGFHSIGEVNHATARYTCKYLMKPHDGSSDERINPETGEIFKVEPECHYMSQGLGRDWIRKFWKDIYSTQHDKIIFKGGDEVGVPAYFHDKLEQWGYAPILMDELEYRRWLHSEKTAHDQTPERLAVREFVHRARIKFNETKYPKAPKI